MGTADAPGVGDNDYPGDVQNKLDKQAQQTIDELNRDDPTRHNDPDSQVERDEIKQHAKDEKKQFTADQHEKAMRGMEIRPGPGLVDAYYPGIPHQALFDMVHTELEPGQVNETGAGWSKLGADLREISDLLRKASTDSESAWSGAAAEGARQFNSGVSQWISSTAQGAVLTANNLSTQSEAAGAARADMPEPVNYTWWDQLVDMANAPDPATGANTVRQKLQVQQDAHLKAITTVATYDQQLSQVSASMPAFPAPPSFDPNAPVPTGPIGGPPPGPRPGPKPGPSGGGKPGTPSGPQPAGPNPSSGPVPGNSRNPSDVRTDSGRAGDTGSSGVSGMGGRFGGSGDSGVFGGAGESGLAGGRGDAGPGVVGGTPLGVPVRLGSGADGGFGHGGGLGGPRSADGAGRGAPRGFGGYRPPGGATAAGAGMGGGGFGDMPMGGPGAGRGDEDEEHRRPSYLIEEKPNELFGTDEPSSPAVIE